MTKNKKIGIVIAVFAAVVIVCVMLFDLFRRTETYEATNFAMGAVITQKIEAENGEEISNEIINKIKETENKISWRIDGSEIASLNQGKSFAVSESTKKYIIDTLDVCRKSNGAVDLTVGGLINEWNIGNENFKIPEEDKLNEILKDVDYKKIKIEGNFISLGENQFLDLGFVGKGIACDEAKTILGKHGAKRAIISVGGSLCLYGKGTFDVGIRNPLGSVNDYMAILETGECFISTSGNYERFSEKDGKKYHHILSTETGYPVENDLLSVTIVCDSGLLSDALSTACYCLGYEKSLPLLKDYRAEAVFIFNDKSVKVTSGLQGKIEIENDEFKLWKEN